MGTCQYNEKRALIGAEFREIVFWIFREIQTFGISEHLINYFILTPVVSYDERILILYHMIISCLISRIILGSRENLGTSLIVQSAVKCLEPCDGVGLNIISQWEKYSQKI